MIITGKESIQWERFFELAPSKGTRGHRYKLFKKRKGTLGQKFFSARVVDLWNELDDSTVSVDNVTVFKRKLGNWVIKQFIVVYSGFNTDYGSSEPLKTLVMLCYVKVKDPCCHTVSSNCNRCYYYQWRI